MENNETPIDKNTSRRDFLKYGLMAGAAAGAGFIGLKAADADTATGETMKLLSPEGELIEVDKSLIDPNIPEAVVQYMEGVPGKKFVMVIDLSRCKNAGKCKKACNKMHGLIGDQSYVKIHKMQDSDLTSPYWMPSICYHCDNPPCVKVCPVGATFKNIDGIVAIDNEKCVGCRFCMAACPYSTRIFNWEDVKVDPVAEKEHHCGTHIRGTVEKCDFCPQMTRKGELPDCVTACPNGVFYFGDENEDTVTNGDETVRLSKLLKDKSAYRFMEDLGTKPRVYYLPPTNRLFEFKDKEEDVKES